MMPMQVVCVHLRVQRIRELLFRCLRTMGQPNGDTDGVFCLPNIQDVHLRVVSVQSSPAQSCSVQLYPKTCGEVINHPAAPCVVPCKFPMCLRQIYYIHYGRFIEYNISISFMAKFFFMGGLSVVGDGSRQLFYHGSWPLLRKTIVHMTMFENLFLMENYLGIPMAICRNVF